MIPIFSKASKQNCLKKKDLYQCPTKYKIENSLSDLLNKWEDVHRNESQTTNSKYSFVLTLFRTFGKCLILP